MQVLLERSQCFVECLEADASISWQRVIRTELAHFPQQIPGRVMLRQHHANWVVDSTEWREWRPAFLLTGFFKRVDKWKQDLLFLKHVRSEIPKQLSHQIADREQFRMICTVRGDDLVCQRFQPRHLFFCEDVMFVQDINN